MFFRQEKESAYKPYEIVYVPNGEKDSPVARDLQGACMTSVKKLKKHLVDFMIKNNYDIKFGKDYMFCVCDDSKEKQVMVTAHLDTVQDPKGAKVIYVERKNNKHYLWSPNGIGGDDRCGIVAIKRLIDRGLKPTVLFCDKEESGGDGSKEFSKNYEGKLNLNCIIELDRQGCKDLVFYDEDNDEWKKYLEKLTGWEEATGSFSDICNLYNLGCASVNLSVGYYRQHTKDEYIVLEEWENAIDMAEKIIKSIDKKWQHIEIVKSHYSLYDSYYDYYNEKYGIVGRRKVAPEDSCGNDNFGDLGETKNKVKEYEISYINNYDEIDTEVAYGINRERAASVFMECYGVKKNRIIDVVEC